VGGQTGRFPAPRWADGSMQQCPTEHPGSAATNTTSLTPSRGRRRVVVPASRREAPTSARSCTVGFPEAVAALAASDADDLHLAEVKSADLTFVIFVRGAGESLVACVGVPTPSSTAPLAASLRLPAVRVVAIRARHELAVRRSDVRTPDATRPLVSLRCDMARPDGPASSVVRSARLRARLCGRVELPRFGGVITGGEPAPPSSGGPGGLREPSRHPPTSPHDTTVHPLALGGKAARADRY